MKVYISPPPAPIDGNKEQISTNQVASSIYLKSNLNIEEERIRQGQPRRRWNDVKLKEWDPHALHSCAKLEATVIISENWYFFFL